MKNKIHTSNDFLLKARKYCDFQDRCHSEMRTKLSEWKVFRKEAEEIIVSLITDGYLNEERFSRSYARGKFRIKKWGKRKIISGLKMKGVTESCIQLGLQEIDETEYSAVLRKIISAKIRNSRSVLENHKAAQYAISRGFESDLVWKIVNERESKPW